MTLEHGLIRCWHLPLFPVLLMCINQDIHVHHYGGKSYMQESHIRIRASMHLSSCEGSRSQYCAFFLKPCHHLLFFTSWSEYRKWKTMETFLRYLVHCLLTSTLGVAQPFHICLLLTGIWESSSLRASSLWCVFRCLCLWSSFLFR